MKRLSIPEPDIKIYEDGFDGHDQLGRATTGKALSDLVDRIDDPMVIALDGGWGSGKSHFLKCWVGQHLKREDNTTQTVYFDAFEHDFLDTPLVSLLACLLNRFEDEEVKDNPSLTVEESKIASLKSAATNIGPASLRIGSSVLAALVKNYVGDVGDALVDQMEKEAANSIDDLWAAAQKQQNVMKEFGEALERITVAPDSSPRKLVIVVDELDRCRPDYALALLEIIKHFFAVDHVHFVLGVNLTELENSVKARYGAGINAGLYLQKFVTVTMGLPDTSANFRGGKLLAIDYYKEKSKEIDLGRPFPQYSLGILSSIRDKDAVTIRGVQRLMALQQLTTLPDICLLDEILETIAAVSLTVLKVFHPSVYKQIDKGGIQLGDLQKIFNMAPDSKVRASKTLFNCWQLFLDPQNYWEREEHIHHSAPSKEEMLKRIREIKAENLEVFRELS